MNHIYKTVWNEQTGTYVAVAEIAKSQGKRSSSSKSSSVAPAVLKAVTSLAFVLGLSGVVTDASL